MKYTIQEVAELFEKYYDKMPSEFNHLRVGDPAMTMCLMLKQLEKLVNKQ